VRPRRPRTDALTRKQRILVLREAGLTRAEVAFRLGVSVKTVQRADAAVSGRQQPRPSA
jgi:DNA-binding CsgD family transcriptional regulator